MPARLLCKPAMWLLLRDALLLCVLRLLVQCRFRCSLMSSSCSLEMDGTLVKRPWTWGEATTTLGTSWFSGMMQRPASDGQNPSTAQAAGGAGVNQQRHAAGNRSGVARQNAR